MKIFFVTGNPHKAEEVAHLFPDIAAVDIDLPEIQSLDPQEIIAAKLEAATKVQAGIIAVEDVSLSLPGLGGLPGTMIKWFIKTLGAAGLYELTKKIGDDRASILCTVGLAVPDQPFVYFQGQKTGRIVAPRAESAFGWNPIFLQSGLEKTYAEMTLSERNTLSHRAAAWGQVREHLLDRGLLLA